MSTLTSSTPPRTSHDHEKEKGPYGHRGADHSDTHVEVQSVVDDGKAAIPLGTYDPVYEAKARVLNDAVSGKVWCYSAASGKRNDDCRVLSSGFT